MTKLLRYNSKNGRNNEKLLNPSCIIFSTNTVEKAVIIQKQIEYMLDNDEELFFLFFKSNLTNLTLGNSFKTISKINNGKLHTEKQPKIFFENKYKELITITGLLIKNITDNLVLNAFNCKFLENTKKILHIDCPTIKKAQTTTLNYVLSSTGTQFNKPNTQLLFYIITFWYESKLFINDAKERVHTSSVAKFTTTPISGLDFLYLLNLKLKMLLVLFWIDETDSLSEETKRELTKLRVKLKEKREQEKQEKEKKLKEQEEEHRIEIEKENIRRKERQRLEKEERLEKKRLQEDWFYWIFRQIFPKTSELQNLIKDEKEREKDLAETKEIEKGREDIRRIQRQIDHDNDKAYKDYLAKRDRKD